MGPDSGRVAHPYGELIELAERERELIGNRDYDGLTGIVEAREALMAKLPATAPEEAHETIGRLLELQSENDVAMRRASAGVEVDLSRLRSGRASVRRYAPAQAPSKRLDFSA